MKLEAPVLPSLLLRDLPFERYRLDIGGGLAMHVMERGEGIPVVMLHGNPTWGYLYRKVARALSPKRYRIIMPDLVGLGFSSRPSKASAHSLENHVMWFDRFLEVLRLDRFVFVGQDWGGPIGFGALQLKPARAAGLVVLNTAIGPPRPGFKPTAFHRFAQTPMLSDIAFRICQFPQAFLGRAQGDRRMPWQAKRAYMAPLLDVRHNAAPLALARMVPDSQAHPSIPMLERSQAFVSSFEGPAAIVWGMRDPILGRMLSWVERNLPRASVTRTDAGHFLQEEVPEIIAANIERVAHDAAL